MDEKLREIRFAVTLKVERKCSRPTENRSLTEIYELAFI